MDTRRLWPFPIPIEAQESEGLRRQIAFFEAARGQGFQAFVQDSLIGATALGGREGCMIPRRGVDGGLRRVWEVTLSRPNGPAEPFNVDGFENAANIVLQWLRGVDSDAILGAQVAAAS